MRARTKSGKGKKNGDSADIKAIFNKVSGYFLFIQEAKSLPPMISSLNL